MHKENPWLPIDDEPLLLDQLEDMPICLSRGCSPLFLNVCSDSMVFPQVLSINTTKLAAVAWARENAAIAVVPASPGDKFDSSLTCKVIRDDRLFMNKTLCVVKGLPSFQRSPVISKLLLATFLSSKYFRMVNYNHSYRENQLLRLYSLRSRCPRILHHHVARR